MGDTWNFKCESCGGVLEFDPKSQKMKCGSCGSLKEIKDMKMDEARLIQQDFKVFTCSDCGAELLTDENTSSTFCSYCGSAALIESRVSGENAPMYVIPFKYKKEEAMEAFRKWCGRGILTPDVFKRSAAIEKISGIYVPFWLFDVNAQLHAAGQCTKQRVTSDSEYEYIHTSYYHINRDISAEFVRLPADASEKMDDEIMDKLEPFDYGELKEFNMAYLSGYLSEKYNMNFERLFPRIKPRVERYMDVFLERELALYDTKAVTNIKSVHLNRAVYAVLPVWILNYRYQGKNYTFAMNGQTGRIVANPPWSRIKAAVWFLCLTILFTLILIGLGRVI